MKTNKSERTRKNNKRSTPPVNVCGFQASANRRSMPRILDNVLKISILFMIMLICPIASETLPKGEEVVGLCIKLFHPLN